MTETWGQRETYSHLTTLTHQLTLALSDLQQTALHAPPTLDLPHKLDLISDDLARAVFKLRDLRDEYGRTIP
jgi:hypothetical protein